MEERETQRDEHKCEQHRELDYRRLERVYRETRRGRLLRRARRGEKYGEE